MVYQGVLDRDYGAVYRDCLGDQSAFFEMPVACGGGDEQMDRRHFLFNALLAA